MRPTNVPVGRTPDLEEAALNRLLSIKGDTTVSVCIPTLGDSGSAAGFVGPITRTLVAEGIVDELIVLDGPRRAEPDPGAAPAGATVVAADDILTEFGPALGRGDVLWRSLEASTGDLVVWLDTDLTSFRTRYVTRLLRPLLENPEVCLVRGTDEHSLVGTRGEGGQVTEVLTRPLIAAVLPELEQVHQPLGHECAVRRHAAERVDFEVDDGVEMGLLLDIAAAHGVASISQVDLGSRTHRNRSATSLREQSRDVLRAALVRTPTGGNIRALRPCRPALHGITRRNAAAV